MKLWCCLVLCALVACGSKREPATDKPADPPKPAAPKPLAVAFVIEGWEMWIGNDVYTPEDDPSRELGALKPLKEAFGRLRLPAGSQATVVTYGEKAWARQPMGPIEKVTAASFGDQKDYAGVIDRNLVAGVTLGLDELARVPDAQRLLIVIGDGTDENGETAKTALAALAKRAASEHVQVVAITYKGALSQPDNPVKELDPNMVNVNTMDALANQLTFTFDQIAHPPPAAPPAEVAGPPPPFTLAILMNDQEVWIGNDEIEPPDSPAAYKGALHAIQAVFDKSPMTGFPAGSKAMLITYDDKATIKLPTTPIEKLDAHALGTQMDGKGKLGTELVAGARLALNELTKIDGGRRVIVILGDGNDTNNEAAKTQLQQLAKQAADRHIEVYAITWKGPLSANGSVITELDPKATTAATTEELTADLVALFRVLRNH
jgi:hypothetical protein